MSATPTDPLFPGFETGRLKTDDAEIYYRAAGDGPPLLLLHGFPQTGAMWATTAPDLSADYRVVVPDLRGYGRSTGPAGPHERYAKSVMAADMIALMEHLGASRFALVGHDRGGRVAYRLALDHPERLSQLAVLDILPSYEYWAQIDRAFALT
nr:alpha/beta hydrolase [Paracoccaceae bacterium]